MSSINEISMVRRALLSVAAEAIMSDPPVELCMMLKILLPHADGSSLSACFILALSFDAVRKLKDRIKHSKRNPLL